MATSKVQLTVEAGSLNAASIDEAVQSVIANNATPAQYGLVERALSDDHWTPFIITSFPELGIDYSPKPTQDQLTAFRDNFRQRLRLPDLPTVVPGVGFWAVHCYGIFVGWYNYLPYDEQAREVYLKAYTEVASAFARLDRLADPVMGAVRKLPHAVEPPKARASLQEARGQIRSLLRVLSLGHLLGRLEQFAHLLEARELKETMDVVRSAFNALRNDLVENLRESSVEMGNRIAPQTQATTAGDGLGDSQSYSPPADAQKTPKMMDLKWKKDADKKKKKKQTGTGTGKASQKRTAHDARLDYSDSAEDSGEDSSSRQGPFRKTKGGAGRARTDAADGQDSRGHDLAGDGKGSSFSAPQQAVQGILREPTTDTGPSSTLSDRSSALGGGTDQSLTGVSLRRCVACGKELVYRRGRPAKYCDAHRQ